MGSSQSTSKVPSSTLSKYQPTFDSELAQECDLDAPFTHSKNFNDEAWEDFYGDIDATIFEEYYKGKGSVIMKFLYRDYASKIDMSSIPRYMEKIVTPRLRKERGINVIIIQKSDDSDSYRFTILNPIDGKSGYRRTQRAPGYDYNFKSVKGSREQLGVKLYQLDYDNSFWSMEQDSCGKLMVPVDPNSKYGPMKISQQSDSLWLASSS